MEHKKFRLNSASSQRAVNEDTFDKIQLESKATGLPVGETSKIINLGEQFDKERQDCKFYRLTGTFDTLFNNVLINTSGTNSWGEFNKNIFRDTNFPPNNSVNDEDDLTFTASVATYLTENNGWFGYYDPDPTNISNCVWIDMEPNRTLFSMEYSQASQQRASTISQNILGATVFRPTLGKLKRLSGTNVKNWELTVTYPAPLGPFPGDVEHPIVKGPNNPNRAPNVGLLLVEVDQSIIGNRNMLTFATPVKHGLSQGDSIVLKGLLDSDGSGSISSYNGQYSVIRVGKDNGDSKEYYFSVDIGELVAINNNSMMARLVNGTESTYYFRVFKKIKTKSTPVIENDDYEIYPLAFAQTIYEDKAYQYVFNEDIDVSDLKDNLGRPLSEIYVTVIKTDSGGQFTPVKSGVKMPLFATTDGNNGISDINRITNDAANSDIPLEDNVTIDDELFYGDVVEYNKFDCIEKTLGEVHHRFNSVKREIPNTVDGVDMGIRYEGYVYKPHHKIQIRQYSNYIEVGKFNTLDRPSYSVNVGGGRYLWRDLLDIGLNDTQETILDYPFLNGSHYINTPITLALFRQDPFGYYGLQWTAFPNDRTGILIEDTIITKRSQDVC